MSKFQSMSISSFRLKDATLIAAREHLLTTGSALWLGRVATRSQERKGLIALETLAHCLLNDLA